MASQITSDPSYDKLIRKALRLIHTKTRRECALAQEVSQALEERDEARRLASIGNAGDETPPEIARVLRSPAGEGHRTVVLYYDGMVIKAALHPSGRRRPAREAAVWRCLRDTAIKVRGARE